MTWRQAQHATNRWAHAFLRAGLEPGDRVGVLARNRIEYALLYFAASRAGVVPGAVQLPLGAGRMGVRAQGRGGALLIGSDEWLESVDSVRGELTGIEHFVALDGGLRATGSTFAAGSLNSPTPRRARRLCPLHRRCSRSTPAARRATQRRGAHAAVGGVQRRADRRRCASWPAWRTQPGGRADAARRRGVDQPWRHWPGVARCTSWTSSTPRTWCASWTARPSATPRWCRPCSRRAVKVDGVAERRSRRCVSSTPARRRFQRTRCGARATSSNATSSRATA